MEKSNHITSEINPNIIFTGSTNRALNCILAVFNVVIFVFLGWNSLQQSIFSVCFPDLSETHLVILH